MCDPKTNQTKEDWETAYWFVYVSKYQEEASLTEPLEDHTPHPFSLVTPWPLTFQDFPFSPFHPQGLPEN